MGIYRQITVAKERKLWTSFNYLEGEVDLIRELVIPFLGDGQTIYDPIYAAVSLYTVPFLTNTGTLYDPVYEIVYEYGPVPLLSNPSTLYDPVYGSVSAVIVAYLASSGTLYDPTITITPNELIVVFLSNPGTLYDPSYQLTDGFEPFTSKRLLGGNFAQSGIEPGLPTIDSDSVLSGSGGIGDVREIVLARGVAAATTNSAGDISVQDPSTLIVASVSFNGADDTEYVNDLDLRGIESGNFNNGLTTITDTKVYVADTIT